MTGIFLSAESICWWGKSHGSAEHGDMSSVWLPGGGPWWKQCKRALFFGSPVIRWVRTRDELIMQQPTHLTASGRAHSQHWWTRLGCWSPHCEFEASEKLARASMSGQIWWDPSRAASNLFIGLIQGFTLHVSLVGYKWREQETGKRY